MAARLSGLVERGGLLMQQLFQQYGWWMYGAASAAKGMLIFPGGEALTPTFVLLVAHSPLDVVLIAAVGAAAVLAGNTLLYFLFRALGDHFVDEETRKTRKWRMMEWVMQERSGLSLFLFRIFPVIGEVVAIPAAFARVRLKTFIVYSYFGFFLAELLIGFTAYYGVKGDLFSQYAITRQALFLINQTAPL